MGKTVQDYKVELSKIKPMTPWEEIQEDHIYHIPPIISLTRRDIYVVKKNEDTLDYISSTDKKMTERTLHKTSVFAKFIVPKKII